MMKSRFNAKLLLGFALFALAFQTQEARAQILTENTPLDFGRFVLVDNAATRTIQINAGGGFTADPQYMFFIDPQAGNFTVTGYGAGVPLTVTITPSPLNNGGGANFTIVSTATDPAAIVTDGAGEATFDLVATLDSDGGGLGHNEGGFTGTYTIMVAP
jgi:hypothetical protein